MLDLIIIGGGPAGLTAAIYAIRKRLDVLLVSEDLGGKTNYRMDVRDAEGHQLIRGGEIVRKFRSELDYLQFARAMTKVLRVDREEDHFVVDTEDRGPLKARALIIATGARQQFLGVPGELEFLGRGLGYSAMSYAPVFIDKRVTVIGEGELALRAAAELSTVAEHVHLVGPAHDEITGPLGSKLSTSPNVTILEEHRVVQVGGSKYLEKVIVQSPGGQKSEIGTDGAFIEMALIPNTEFVAHLVARDEKGRIKVDSGGRTSLPGIFAAGDVTNTTEQVLVAVGEGAKAALRAYEYLLPTL